jgi:hypothetical protein
MSIYKERKRTFAAELAQTSAEREQFKTTLAVRFGKEASEPRKLPEEDSIAAKKLQTLDRKVMAVRKKIRTPDCWFRESPGPISVLDLVGLSWRMVNEKCSADGRLPISGVLWLLNVLRTTDQVMPRSCRPKSMRGNGWQGDSVPGTCRKSGVNCCAAGVFGWHSSSTRR